MSDDRETFTITAQDVGVLRIQQPAFAVNDIVTVKGKPGRGIVREVRNDEAGIAYRVKYAADDAVHSPIENWWPESELVG